MTAPELSAEEAAIVARFDAAETPPEVLVARVRVIADDYDDGDVWGGALHHGYSIRKRLLAALDPT